MGKSFQQKEFVGKKNCLVTDFELIVGYDHEH